MNANAVYSKSGKGVQEASGKTSHLSRPDRSVLSAIDGRATLAEVAAKVGKTFDPAFEKLIETLDKGGFVREVSPGTAAPAKPGAAAKPGAKPGAGAPMDAVSDLDFTAAMSAPKSKSPPPPPQALKATPPPAKHTATIPPPPPPPSASEKAQAAKAAKEQQDAFAKARAEAEEKAAAERERVKAEAEAKMRAETEAKLRAESTDAQKKLAEADAKIKAARDAAAKVAAEAKAKAEAEAKKAREEADRVRKETEEKARREREELNRKLEEERKAREEAERKAKEEAKRLEEERRKLEEERKREEQERAERRKREEQEAEERRRKREEEEERERAEREAKREAERAERKRQEQEEEEREKAQKAMRDARRKMEQRKEEEEEEKRRAERKKRDPDEPEEEEKPKAKPKKAPEPEPSQPAGGGISDSLLADLDSFTNREEEDRKAQEEEERKKKEEAARRAREAEERRAKEDAERQEREEKEKKRLRDEEEKRKKEAEEREKKSKQDERLTANATRATAYDADAERRSKRERELGPKPKTAGAAAAHAEKKGGLGKTLMLGLLGLAVVAVGVAHVMPIDTADYERAATEALGRQVKIGSARLSLFSGLQIKFSGVAVGDEVKIAEVRGYPGIGALTGPKKDFSRIEIDGAKIDQRAVGAALFVKVKADNFSVGRIVAKQIEFPGPLVLPKGLDLEINYDAEGAVQSAVVRGPEALVAKLAPKGSSIEVDMSASSFTLPFAPEISLSKFGLKGSTTSRGLAVSEWDGSAYGGTLAGTANVIWGDTWAVDGVVTARNLNAAVFAPALLSEGKGDGSGKFSMRGQPGKLADAARIDGTFTVSRGVLGSIDLSRAIQTGGKQATGRTQFNEMNGQGVYDRGAVALRNVTLSAGLLNAGASVDIAQSGALSGRIVADVKVQRATLSLGGTIKEPQVRN